MKIIYIIGGVSPEYQGWLRISKMNANSIANHKSNCDQVRQIVIKHVNNYMNPAGQKYLLFWAEVNQESITSIYHELVKDKIPRYRKTEWFSTDVWTVRKALSHKLPLYNCRRLKPLVFARYLDHKYQRELNDLLMHPNNSKSQRFKRDFYNEWNLSSIDSERVRQTIRVFSAYLLVRNLVNSVPKGCRKVIRKLVPLRMDDLSYDLKLLDYKFRLNQIIQVKDRINSLSGKPFGTAEFTNQYLVKHAKFLQIFDSKFLKRYFNL